MEALREGRSASFRQIERHLRDNDMVISSRTLQRDINQIRVDFGVDIKYERYTNKYEVDQTTSINLPGFYQFLELRLTTELLEAHLRQNKDSLRQYIQLEPLELFRGYQNLKELLQAILLKRWVTFDYTRFAEDGTKSHQIIPCLLKRYQSRWYVIGKTSSGRTATFGLDRITKLKRTAKSFKESEVIIPESLDAVVGLDYSGKPERVLLKAIPLQAKYLLALPLHHSQKVVATDQEGTVFEYQLIANFELVQAILRLGDQVKVVEPPSLVTEVKQRLQSALSSYS
jgi:predicted DNA-binding transcriptional regulator YafY